MRMAEKNNDEARSHRSHRSERKRYVWQQDKGVRSAPEYAVSWRWRGWFHAAAPIFGGTKLQVGSRERFDDLHRCTALGAGIQGKGIC